MARNRQNLNIIYISDRMRETLRPIASCALTAVVAPMGYGKTTAVRWFLAEQAKAGAVVLQASIYSDNRSIFWKSVQKAFAAAGLTVLEGYDCPADASGAALLLEDLCAALGGKTPYYLFLDDFHLLGDERVAQFLCRLAYRLPENVHLIVASRNRFLPGEQVVRLGRRLHRIEADGLRLNREELLAYTHRCGVEITAAQAESLLRSCEGWFSAVYLNLHALAERGNLLGECDLIQSFLFYNDITQMSRLHRSASRQMSRPAVTLRNSGSWTFGSPSVLMMYYRAPGELGKELAEMYECMPHYYKITNGHGRGAELLMDAEAAYLQGAWEKAAVLLERARADAAGQENMTLCCDFLALRLALCGKGKEGYDFAAKRAALLQKHDGVQVHLLESIAAYFYALQGRPEQAPELFREHKLAEVSFFGPCRPMMSLIEQQVWLAQGEYVKVIAHSEGLLRRCEAMHYGLVGLQARIQLAAAQLRFGQRAEARAALAAALLDAVQDDFWVLFVEQYPALAPLLEGEDWAACEPRLGPFVARILPAGRAFAARLGLPAPAPELPLTDRDRELARLVAGRCTNKEIAAALYLSEGTVKQYINQLYAKLDMGGDPRTRRARLAEWYQKNAPRN